MTGRTDKDGKRALFETPPIEGEGVTTPGGPSLEDALKELNKDLGQNPPAKEGETPETPENTPGDAKGKGEDGKAKAKADAKGKAKADDAKGKGEAPKGGSE